MRTLLLLAISLALAALAGCGRLGHADADLDRAASLMQTRPDSALCIVRGVDGDMPRKALYEAWALCKSYRVDDMDSALCKAADYYRAGHGSPSDRMIFHYLSGMSEVTAHNYGSAVENLLKAEELGKTLHDNLYLGLIYRYLADTFDDLYNQQIALKYSRLSYDAFLRDGESIYTDYAMCDLAVCSNNAFEYDSAILYADRAYLRGVALEDTMLASTSLRVKAASYIAQKNYQKAYDVLSKMEAEFGLIHDEAMRNMALSCLHLGFADRAKSYMNQIKDAKMNNFMRYNIYASEKDYRRAYECLEKEYDANDSILFAVMGESANKQIANYYSSREKESQLILQNAKTRFRLILAFCVLFALMSVIIIRQRLILHRKSIAEKMQIIEELNADIKAYQKSLTDNKEDHQSRETSLRSDVNSIFAERFSLLDRLCGDYYESQGTSGEKSKIFGKIQNLVQSLHDDKKTIQNLSSTINRYKDNVLDRFKADVPSLSQDEELLFLYLVIGLSSRSISAVFGIRIDAVYNRKAKLKKKIEQLPCESKELYLQYF